MTGTMIGRRGALGGGLAAALAVAAPAHAQQPARTLRWVVGYPPGGATDIVARLLGAQVAPRIGQTVVVENRAGAATIVAAEHVAKSPPDGQTVMTVDMGTMVYNRALFRRLPYDPARDFRPVALYARFDFMLVVNADLPVRGVADLVALCRQRPGQIGFASPGIGSPHHLGLEQFRRRAGIEVNHVPYRGAAPAVTDLTTGVVQAMVLDFASASAQLPGGRLRPLAVMSARRIAQLPDVPTMAEAGFPGNETYSWQGLVAPAGTPDAAVARLNEAVAAAVGTEEIRQRLAMLGAEPLTGPPERLRDVVEQEAGVWIPLIQELGLNLEF